MLYYVFDKISLQTSVHNYVQNQLQIHGSLVYLFSFTIAKVFIHNLYISRQKQVIVDK